MRAAVTGAEPPLVKTTWHHDRARETNSKYLAAPDPAEFRKHDPFETTNRKDMCDHFVEFPNRMYKNHRNQGPFMLKKMPGYKRPTHPRQLERKGYFSKHCELEIYANYRKRAH